MAGKDAQTCRFSDDIATYALGSLPVAAALDFEAHLVSCEMCRAELEQHRACVADLALAAGGVEPSSDLLPRLKARIHALPTDEEDDERPWRTWAADPKTGVVFALACEGVWVATGVDGIEARKLFVDRESDRTTMLIRMGPGASYPAHDHGGDEECYVIQGDLSVGDRTMRGGDYQFAPAGTAHPVQSTEEGCLLLIVSSTRDEFHA